MQSRFHTAVFALAVVATAPAFAGSTAPKATGAAPDTTFLQNAFDGRAKCLAADKDTVQMAQCDKSAAQQWVLERSPLPGYFRVHTVGGGAEQCLAVNTSGNGAAVRMAACSNADNQQWAVQRSAMLAPGQTSGEAGGILQFTNQATGKTRCLESMGSGLKISPCDRRELGHRWLAQWSPTM